MFLLWFIFSLILTFHRSSRLLQIKWNSNGSQLRKAYPTDAGYDIIYHRRAVLNPNTTTLIDTDLIIQIPSGYCGIIKARSSTFKKSLSIIDGVIDAGYCGTIKLQVRNESNKAITLRSNTAIAQIIFLPVPDVYLQRVESFDKSQRGENGLGSSDNGVINDDTE